MRPLFLLPLLFSTLALTAASPWENFIQRHKGLDPRTARWTLCMRSGELPPIDAVNNEILVKLVIGGDLALEPLEAAEAKDLWHQREWDERPHWVLLTPEATVATAAGGQPKGEEILDAMHASGSLARWEAREAFLKEHPEQGEARLEDIGQAFRLMRSRLTALDRMGKVRVPAWHPEPGAAQSVFSTRVSLAKGPEGEAQADELYAPLAPGLAAFFKVPGWQRETSSVSAQLMFWDLSQSTAMRRLFEGVSTQAERLFQSDPYRYDLANFWMEANEAAGRPPDIHAGSFLPVPGRCWPTPAILNRLGEPFRRRQDWDGALKFLSDLAPQNRPEPATVVSWDEYNKLLCATRVQQGLALAAQGAWDMAGSSLEDASQIGGGQGVREALLLRGGQWAGAPAEQGLWRNLLTTALAKNNPKPPAPVPEPPLRLVILGSPKWILAWSSLHQAAELAPWSPGELRWEAAPRETHLQWQQKFSWGPGPRWALFRGEELRSTGESCPSPRALADLLTGEGQALLQRFERMLNGQPDHIPAHAARFALLMRRMPDKRLEATLAEDAAAAMVTLDFDPSAAWKPDLELWGGVAQQVLPRIEEELRSWPSRSALWTLWISWARFHPRQPSILSLAQSLPYWYPRGDWRTGLPYAVQRAVAAELRRQGSFDAMRTWYRAAWEVLDHRSLAALRPGERAWIQQRRKEEETAIFQPLRDALQALGCTEEQTQLERVFGAMVGREAAKR